MAKIFLIGYMGSGKSTVGKKLAAKLPKDFQFISPKFPEEAFFDQMDVELSFMQYAIREKLTKSSFEIALLSNG